VAPNGFGMSGYGTRMVWLITGLLLAVLCGLMVLTRWARHRPVTDDTLLADLLGPPAGQAPPAPPEWEDVERVAGGRALSLRSAGRTLSPRRCWPRSPLGKRTGWKPRSRRLRPGRSGCKNKSPPGQTTRTWPGRDRNLRWLMADAGSVLNPASRPSPGPSPDAAWRPPPPAANANSQPDPAIQGAPSTANAHFDDLSLPGAASPGTARPYLAP